MGFARGTKTESLIHGPLEPWLPQFPYRASALKSPGTLVSQCISVILGSHVYFLGVGLAISLEKIIRRDPTMIIPSQWTDWREHLQKNAALAPQIYGSPVSRLLVSFQKQKTGLGNMASGQVSKKQISNDLNTFFEKSDVFSLNTFYKHSTNHGVCRGF